LPDEFHHPSYARRANRRVMDGTPSERRGGPPAGVRRLLWDAPSKAITGGAKSEFLHPLANRYLTVRECARLQTFPDDFTFDGSPSEQGQLIGNAVPPLFAEVLGRNLEADLRAAQGSAEAGALLSFVPTLSDGASPVLKQVTAQVQARFLEQSREAEFTLW
jgi:DNA (cytosine-5)-methyltransferase 1